MSNGGKDIHRQPRFMARGSYSPMSYQSRLYAEHGLKPGASVIRLSAIRDGQPWTCLYLYDTAASITADMGGMKNLPEFKRERVAWDGVERVSCCNGD